MRRDGVYIFDPDQGGIISYGPQNNTAWKIVTLVSSSLGLAVSTIALTLLILTAALFPEWRRIYKNQILLQFMIARYIYTLVRFFYDLTTGFQIYNPAAFFLQLDLLSRFYTEMALVAWMYLFSKQMYDSLVKVFHVEPYPLWKVSLIAWLIPALISFILYLALFFQSTNREFHIFATYVILVKWPMLVSNALFLITVIKSVLKTNSQIQNNRRIIIVMIVLVFTFCFQQIFTDIYRLVCIYIYFQLDVELVLMNIFIVLTNLLSLYFCAFSISFWLFGNKHTRELWKFQMSRDKKKLLAQNSIISRVSKVP